MNMWEKSSWIWINDEPEVNQYADFVSDFQVENPENIHLYISCDTQYEVWINGKFASAQQYSDFPDEKIYDDILIDRFVKKGKNYLYILGYSQGENSATVLKGKAALIFSIVCGEKSILGSGKNIMCRKSRCYKSGEISKITPQLSYSFEYDGTADDGIKEKKYASSGCKPAVEIPVETKLSPRPVKNTVYSETIGGKLIDQGVFTGSKRIKDPGRRMYNAYLSHERLKYMTKVEAPITLKDAYIAFHAVRGSNIYFIVDLQKEYSGLFTMDITLPEAVQIDIGYGEHLDDLRVRTYLKPRSFAAVYHGRAGRQKFTHYIKRFGCRYLEIHIYCKECVLHTLGLIPVYYPQKEKPVSELCGLREKIYKTSVHTLKICMHEHYEDTPWREQALYAMDSRLQMLCGYNCFEGTEFQRSSLRIMAKGQRPDGLLELCNPGRTNVTIPLFSLMYVLAVGEYMNVTRDLPFLNEVLPVLERLIEAFDTRLQSDDLISNFIQTPYWNFYEWRKDLDGGKKIARKKDCKKATEAPLNAAYVMALDTMSMLYKQNGTAEKSDLFALRAKKTRTAVKNTFYDEKNKSYYTYRFNRVRKVHSQLATSLCVLCGAYDSERLYGILLNLANNNNDIPVTLSNQFFRFEALLKMPDDFAGVVTSDIENIWGRMLEYGATSFWETENGASDFDDAGSLSHGWSAIPAYFYQKYKILRDFNGQES